MTTRGTPLLYYGDEIAMAGGGDPDNRRDFPGGFSGDARNAFTKQGRTAPEQDVFEHVRRLGRLRAELEPLRRGRSLDLLDAEQQMAYARITDRASVIVVFNNDTKPATVEFNVTETRIANGAQLTDRLGASPDVRVESGKMKVTIGARRATIFTVR